MRAHFFRLELVVVAGALSVGCQQTRKRPAPTVATSVSASAASELTRLLAPRAASRFEARDNRMRQAHPRLPDAGEWRCAERDNVVWCAGGEAAAGIVSGPPDAGYRCGPRWGNQEGERVCIDLHPDYPDPSDSPYGDGQWQCRFEQEHGVARVCERAAPHEAPALPDHALPACWLDRDCPSSHCERGACGCSSPAGCKSGRCAGGVCVEVKP